MAKLCLKSVKPCVFFAKLKTVLYVRQVERMSHLQPFLDWDWVSLGFRSPFANLEQNIFTSQGLKVCLAQLADCTQQQYSRVEIMAPPGGGLTTLLRLLHKTPSSKLTVLFMCANTGLCVENFIKALCYKLEINRFPSKVEPGVFLLRALSERPKPIRLLIDNAHLLPKSTADFINNICSLQKSASPLQFVLAKHFSSQPSANAPNVLMLPTLSFKETQSYLENLIPQGMLSPDFEDSVSKIYQETHGNLKKIIEKAPKFLRKAQTPTCSNLNTFPAPPQSPLHTFGGITAFIISGLLGALIVALPPSKQQRSLGLNPFTTLLSSNTTKSFKTKHNTHSSKRLSLEAQTVPKIHVQTVKTLHTLKTEYSDLTRLLSSSLFF